MNHLFAPVVDVCHVTKVYSSNIALNEVSFTIMPGECFALLGPNGAGKTTLLRMLTNIIKPDTGHICMLGTGDLASIKDRIGYLPEERGLYKRQKISDVLEYFGRLKGLSASHARARCREVLASVGMSQYAKSRPETLSKGMAQRIQFAAALIHDPEFVIFDEPFSGLDPVSAQAMRELLLAEKARGRTFLLSTHQMNPVEQLCDRLLMLRKGEMVLHGTLPEIQARFQTGVVRVEHSGTLPIIDGIRAEPIGEGVTRLQLTGDLSVDAALKKLIDGNAIIRSFIGEKPSLEDIFIRVAGVEEGQPAE